MFHFDVFATYMHVRTQCSPMQIRLFTTSLESIDASSVIKYTKQAPLYLVPCYYYNEIRTPSRVYIARFQKLL